jgi:hypothetical protein
VIVLLAPLFLAAAASTRVELIDERVSVPAGDWRYAQIALQQRTALISAEYAAETGGQRLRLAIVPREDLEGTWKELAATFPGVYGRLTYRVPVRGVYAVLIDNRDGDRPTTVHLQVFLDFAALPGPEVTRLSRRRQFTVIAISFIVFFAIVSYSARRLLRGIRR